jgi:hypothetical protein
MQCRPFLMKAHPFKIEKAQYVQHSRIGVEPRLVRSLTLVRFLASSTHNILKVKTTFTIVPKFNRGCH